MPVFFCQVCQAKEVGGEGEVKMRNERKGKNKQGMKADTENHQLRTTATIEPDRAWTERTETVLEERKDNEFSLEKWKGKASKKI